MATYIRNEEDMFVNKIGYHHIEDGSNNQDYGFLIQDKKSKLVCDGCSEGKNSEVGAKLFSYALSSMELSTDDILIVLNNLEEAFKRVSDVFFTVKKDMNFILKAARDYLCFTILFVKECENYFRVLNCGDGYIILQDKSGEISFLELNDGEYPKYYIYNFLAEDAVKHYKSGVYFEYKSFRKDDYLNVGIASDGIRFIVNSDDEALKEEFIKILKSGKESAMKRFINRNQKLFNDDVTISF